MKNYFMTLLACGFMGASASVSAFAASPSGQVPAVLVPQKVQFFYSDPYSIYSCDAVQYIAKNMLKNLGARNIDVNCSGGLPYTDSNAVTATFSTLQLAPSNAKPNIAGTVTSVTLNAHDSCDLNKTVFEDVIKSFRVYSTHEYDSCWDASGDFQAQVQVLK